MIPPKDPKNKGTNKANESSGHEVKAIPKKEGTKEEQDTVPVDKDAKNYFDSHDEDHELRHDDNLNIPL